MDQEEIHMKFYDCLRTRETPLWLFPCDDRAGETKEGTGEGKEESGPGQQAARDDDDLDI